MAGDLFIENISSQHLTFLREAFGELQPIIFHANRSWDDGKALLEDRRKKTNGPSLRTRLPAHSYVTFPSARRDEIYRYVNELPPTAPVPSNYEFKKTAINTLKLGNVLEGVSRPLGIVSENANLSGWPDQVGMGPDKVVILVKAVSLRNVVLEYYKVDETPILSARATVGWVRMNE